ncbi:LuxR C-terminal-related transcriptional regulator [Nocardia halotolerans]|uniref:LuxR C-terminal-related transcriptional regulator n=1 Tax=Nocardia halotolerans TaxID=1755878 RepID=A0ABV8VH53_9NOCA
MRLDIRLPPRRTLVAESGCSTINGEFQRASRPNQQIRLAPIPAMVATAAGWQPDIVLLDASTDPRAGLAPVVRQLRSLDRRPLIALLVHKETAPQTLEVDLLLAADFRADAILDALEVAASGIILATAALEHADRIEADPDTYQRLSLLTGRETEILYLIVDGLSNREVGARLFISPDTVKEHVSRILAKLGVNSRIEAAVVAVRAESWRTSA